MDRNEDIAKTVTNIDIGRNNVFSLFREALLEARQSRSATVRIRE